jgi:aminoglycoside phosphotransferase (APT) family kinase protein
VIDDHRRLVAARFPQLDVRAFEPIGTGWTYDTYEVNGEWIVQVPRSPYGEQRLRAQRDLLPELARELPTAIPVPEWVSDDPPAIVYRKLEGVPCLEAPDGIWPERLGRFLYDLHMTPPELVGLRTRSPEDIRSEMRDAMTTWRRRVYPLLEATERSACDSVLDPFLDDDTMWRFGSCLTHGDLGPDHVLVSKAGDLSGVLDWEEASVGDPVWDFAWWLHSTPDVGTRMLGAYGGAPDAAFFVRARACYLLMPFHEVVYGLDEGLDVFVASGVGGIRDRLSEPRTMHP